MLQTVFREERHGGLAMARYSDLIEERLRAGINREIAEIDRLVALQVHDHHISAVVVEGEAQRRLAIRRVRHLQAVL